MWLPICLGEEQGVPSRVSKVLPLAFSPIPQDKVALCYSLPHGKHTCLPEPKLSLPFCVLALANLIILFPVFGHLLRCQLPDTHPWWCLKKPCVFWYMFSCLSVTCTANDPCVCGLAITITEIVAFLKSDVASEAVRSLVALPEDRIMSVLDSWLVPKNISC